MTTLLYRRPALGVADPTPTGVTATKRRARDRGALPTALAARALAAWRILDSLGPCACPGYGVIGETSEGTLAYRAMGLPRYVLGPLLGRDDQWSSDSLTLPAQCGHGLETLARRAAPLLLAQLERTLWWRVAANNTPSRRAVERAGWRPAGRPTRHRWLDIPLAGTRRFAPPGDL